jgi:hypothetical protein
MLETLALAAGAAAGAAPIVAESAGDPASLFLHAAIAATKVSAAAAPRSVVSRIIALFSRVRRVES